jgi:hypothetical protein
VSNLESVECKTKTVFLRADESKLWDFLQTHHMTGEKLTTVSTKSTQGESNLAGILQ